MLKKCSKSCRSTECCAYFSYNTEQNRHVNVKEGKSKELQQIPINVKGGKSKELQQIALVYQKV